MAGTFYYPLDEVLDLPPGEVTVGLARRALRLSTHLGFSDLQEELFYQHDVRLSGTVEPSWGFPGWAGMQRACASVSRSVCATDTPDDPDAATASQLLEYLGGA